MARLYSGSWFILQTGFEETCRSSGAASLSKALGDGVLRAGETERRCVRCAECFSADAHNISPCADFGVLLQSGF